MWPRRRSSGVAEALGELARVEAVLCSAPHAYLEFAAQLCSSAASRAGARSGSGEAAASLMLFDVVGEQSDDDAVEHGVAALSGVGDPGVLDDHAAIDLEARKRVAHARAVAFAL